MSVIAKPENIDVSKESTAETIQRDFGSLGSSLNNLKINIKSVEVNNNEEEDRAAYRMKWFTWLDVFKKRICVFIERNARSFI